MQTIDMNQHALNDECHLCNVDELVGGATYRPVDQLSTLTLYSSQLLLACDKLSERIEH